MENNENLKPEELVKEEPKQTTEEPLNIKLEEDDGTKGNYSIPWKGLIFIGVIITLMAVCIIVIGLNGGFNA